VTYKETLNWLYAQLPMFHRVGAAAFKKDLTNTLAICAHLGNPEKKFPSIHIGGTNGKGSTAHLIAAMLQAQGYKVGLYVSPHYRDFRERIKINGNYISPKNVTKFIETHKDFFENLKPSFFEMTVGLAFDYFAEQQVDIAVIEVGMGGRFDSTNVITPLLSVITNISFDHVQFLGDTLPKIAFEKAGIIKPQTPVVIGEWHAETAPVFEQKAAETASPISFASENFYLNTIKEDVFSTDFEVFKDKKILYKNLKVGLKGEFQQKNIATALQAISVFNALIRPKTNFYISENAILRGVAEVTSLTNLIGRWQILNQSPLIICDSGHNEAGIQAVIKNLEKITYQHLHIVLGVVNDKDITKMLAQLPKHATYYFAKANIPRGLAADLLRGVANEQGLYGKAYTSVRKAFAAAQKKAATNDLIFIGGSIFVVAEIR
jgi:dihydrofolate synthase/folylpolyglutamate synthase